MTLPRAEQYVSGLRTRYSPRSRIAPGFVTVAPWIDVVLLFCAFVLLESRVLVQGGIEVALPRIPPGVVTRADAALIVMVVRQPAGGLSEAVYFDEMHYLPGDERDVQRLQGALTALGRDRPGAALTIYADSAVSHGTVSRLTAMAIRARLGRVNVAVRPE